MGTGAGRYTGQELNATAPLQRDTVVIPAYSWIVLRFITDNRKSYSFLSLSRQSLIMRYDQSGRVGVPLPHCVAYGSWVVNAVQQSAVDAGGTGRAAGHRGSMRTVMILPTLSGGGDHCGYQRKLDYIPNDAR